MLDKSLPARAAELLSKPGVGQLGVGYGDLTLECLLSDLLQFTIHGAVHPADEERRDGIHPRQLDPSLGESFQPSHVCLGDSVVLPERKHKGHVDVDPFSNERLNGGDSLRSGWNLDHDVGAIESAEEVPRLGDGAVRIAGQGWAHLEAHKAIGTVGGFVHGTQ